MDRFSIEIETLYFNDTGTQENVFKLSGSELKNRVVGKDNKHSNQLLGECIITKVVYRCDRFR